ncbi:MAG: asparagine synthase-related protein, partial [Pseudomonadota bacterium]
MTQAVAGYLDLGAGPPDAALVHRMLDAIAPAGLPSARAALVRGPVAMGALSLASNDGLTPKPPRVLEAGDMLVAADMRLYGDGAAQPETALMDALTRHGPKAAAELHGDFGLACWNAAADALWLMRDHVGVRPVFYTVRPGHHAAFASHPSALLQTGLASRALDETGIAQSVVMARPVAPRTRYRDVKTVRPGQTVTVSRSGAVEERRVWRLPLGQLIPLSENKAAVAEELRRLLIQAVHRRLDEAGPAFGHLSGGLDSTPIAVIAARHAAERGEDFHAYSIVEPEDLIDQDAGDERRFAADTVAMEPNMVPHWINPALPTDLAGTVDLDTGQIVHPDSVADQMGRDAAHRGIRVMLTGWAGDEVVSMRTHNWGSAELFWSGRIADAMERLRA